MTNRELLRAGVIASAILLMVGGLSIYRLTEWKPSGATGALPPLEARQELPPPTVMEGLPQVTETSPQRAARDIPMDVYSAARVPKGAEAQVQASRRREALRQARVDLIAGFTALRTGVERCGAGEASFILALEALDGGVRIDSARVEVQGNVPTKAVACAESELAGKVIPGRGFVAGRRWEVTF